MELADKIKQARTRKALTQADLATAVGVTPRAVQFWEAGRSEPRPGQIRSLSKVLDEPLDYFMEAVA